MHGRCGLRNFEPREERAHGHSRGSVGDVGDIQDRVAIKRGHPASHVPDLIAASSVDERGCRVDLTNWARLCNAKWIKAQAHARIMFPVPVRV